MYCLEKFQRELAYFLDIDLRDLPKVQEILQSQGYTAVKKNDEIIELGNKIKGEDSYKTITQQEALDLLETLPTTALPKELDIDTFLKSLDNIGNKENFIEHLQSKTDAQSRLAYLNLVEPTLKQPQMILEFSNKKEYIKSFADENGKNILNLIITKQDDTMLVTMIPNVKASYLKSEINKADIIRSFIPQGSNKERTTTAHSTTNNLKWQQDGNVLRSVVELDNGEKLLLSKDRLENVYIQSNFKEQINSYDELMLQESLEKFAKNELENKLAKHIESKSGIAKLDSAQIQSQIQKEAKAQQEAADYFAKTQAKRDEIIALKEARLGKNADEVPLDKGQDILYKPIRDTSIVLNDETAPFEAEFAVVKLSDIKPNFDNSNTQGRLIKQESVIANIVNDFKPELIFYQEGGVNGVPIITRDGKVVSGNHRSQALKQIFNSQTHNAEIAQQKYKQGAKEFLGVELENDEIIVRRLKENMSDKQILQLAFSSNIGRESTMGEKALSTLSLYRQNIATLPKALQSENVNELKSLVAKHIDKQGNGLNTFEPNLALLTSLARNGKNSNILQSLDSIKGNAEYKNKIINMYVDNAGSFYNLAHNPSFKNLEFRDILSDAIFYTAKQNPTRELDYTHLINDIESFLNLAKDKQALKNALVLDSNKVENLTAQAFGVALAKFSRQENPSSALYECLKEAPKALELATQPTFFTQGKALSEVDIYDFLEYLINQGQVTQSQSALSQLMPRLRELRESIANPQSSVSKADSSLATPKQKTIDKVDSYAKSDEFKTLSKDKQEAILSLKDIEPSPIPQEISIKDLEHLSAHFESKLDKEQREKFLTLFNDTKENPHIVLEVLKNSEIRQEYIKAYQHKESKDLYYLAISKDQRDITGIPTTQIQKVINDVVKSERVLSRAENFQGISNTAAPLPKQTSLERSNDIIPQDSTKAQSEYFNPFMNEYEKIKEIKKLHTQDDNLIRVMKIEGRSDYIEPLSNMGVSKEYLQKQTAQSLKEQITQAILDNQTQLKALQQGYNTYHLSPFQKEVLESALDIANNPAKLKAYKLQGLQKQLDNLSSNEAYHIEKGREYDKARYAKDRQELEREIAALKGESNDIVFTDKKGKEHTLTQEVQEQWLKTFNLKSLDESYTPKLPQDLQEAIGKEIKLTKGSLYKIIEKGREQYIPQIKETLEKPQIVLQDESELIFAKQIKDDLYLTSIGKDFDTHITIISNSPKTDKTIQNKLKNGKMIYKAENAEALPTSGAFTETNQVPFSNTIIPQMPKDNSDPAKTFQYFKDDFVKAYPKVLEYFEGHEPNAIYLSHYAKEEIQEANKALFNTAKDEFSRILKDIGFKQSEINQVLDFTNRYDVEYSLSKVREYLDYAQKHYDTLPQDQQTLAKDLLKHKQDILNIYESKIPQYKELENKRILMGSFHNNAKVFGSDEHQMLKGFIDEFYKPQTIKDSIQDNPQLSALQTKIQQSRQQIAESKNPDKEYLHQVFKPDEIIELEKQYFNQVMPKEYKEMIQDFPRLYEQSLADNLKTYKKDTDTIKEVTTQLLNDFKDKSFKDTAKHAELLLFNTLRDKAQELGFKELDINKPSFKVAFGKFQAKLKKGDIQDLSEHIATSSLQHDRLRIQEALDIKPLKEFGTNYAEHYHSGESAIAKLINEKQGQVSGAFYRKELGDIDLVWGDSKKGLQHIIERRMQDFIEKGLKPAEAEQKALEFVKSLPDIIENGSIDKGAQRVFLDTESERAVIALDYNGSNGKWILTAYIKDDKAPISAYPHQNKLTDSTSSPIVKSALTKDIIPQTTQEIIKQAKQSGKSVAETKELIRKNKELKSARQKFNYDEYANKIHKDLLESSKNKQGVEMIAIYTHKQMPIHTLREELKTILKPIVNLPITNQNDKRVAVLSNKAIAKMYSTTSIQKSVKNGFTQEEHFVAAQNIKKLFENAKLQTSTSDRSGDTSLTIHRYMADLNVNNKNAQAKITIKETLKDGNRIYTMELMELSRSSD